MSKKISVVFSLLVLYLFASLQYYYQILTEFPFLQTTWMYQISILVAISFLINLIVVFLPQKNNFLKTLYMIFQSFTLILILASCGSHFLLLCLFIFTYSIQLYVYEMESRFLQLTIPFIVLLFYVSLPSKLWDIPVEGFNVTQIIVLFLFTFFVQVAFIFLKSIFDKNKKLERQVFYFNALINKIYEANSGIQNNALETELKSAEAERKRISRDIHDIMGYTLVNLRVMLEAANDLVDSTNYTAKNLLSSAIEHSQKGLKTARTTLYNLREYEDPIMSWENRVCNIARIFSDATKIKVHVSFGNVTYDKCPIMISAVYQFVQEALTNSFKHGEATIINIDFSVENNFLAIRVRDNGKGATDTIIEGIGFTGMQERLAYVQGAVVYKNIDDGFEVKCVIPLSFFQKV